MANQLKVALIKSIQSLRAQRWSFRRIARELGIHRETVARYVRLAEAKPAKAPLGSGAPDSGSASEAGVAPTAAEPAKALFGSAVGHSTCEPWREIILAKLDAGLSAQRIFQDVTSEAGFAGSYHSVRRFVAKFRSRSALPFRRLECVAGDEAQVDFGTAAPLITPDGQRRRPYVFRIVLSHSRKGYSEVSLRQTTEDFLRCLESAFWHFGGVPRTLVIDNLRAAVKHPDWYDPELVPKLAEFCRHYGTVILPTKPYMPRHKGKIERGVGYVKGNALAGRTFRSVEEQNQFLWNWEATVADTRIHGTTREQVARRFHEVERALLLPLPAERFAFFHEAQRSVNRDGHVEVAKAYYSVPPEYLARRVWVRWDARLVRIFNERWEQIAVHLREAPGRFRTAPVHIAREKISGIERGATWLLGKAKTIGPHSLAWAEAMLKARGIEGVRVLQGLLRLAGSHHPDNLEKACEIALAAGVFQLRPLRKLLARHAAKQQQIDFAEEHPIIRPLSDYRDWLGAALSRPRAEPSHHHVCDPPGSRAAHGGFLRHGWTDECGTGNTIPRAKAASLPAKSLGNPATDHRGLRVIHPPRSGYPSSGCTSAEPDSVSPDESTVDHTGPLSSGLRHAQSAVSLSNGDASRSVTHQRAKEM
jgi:transposase